MAVTQAQKDAVIAQLLSGVRRVVIDGREVEYHGPQEQERILEYVNRQLSSGPKQTYVVASKGF